MQVYSTFPAFSIGTRLDPPIVLSGWDNKALMNILFRGQQSIEKAPVPFGTGAFLCLKLLYRDVEAICLDILLPIVGTPFKSDLKISLVDGGKRDNALRGYPRNQICLDFRIIRGVITGLLILLSILNDLTVKGIGGKV